MRAWQVQAWGDLVLAERPAPDPGHGQVRLRMRAVSLNYRDLLTIAGKYNPRQPLPLVPCSDGVGVVEAVGPGVDRVAVGDRVAPIFCQSWLSGEPSLERLRSTLGGPLDGTLSEVMVVDQEGVVALPDSLDDAAAACLPCAGVTAWSALVTHGQLQPGDTLLVQGTGGVSIFALQIAKMLGAFVIVTSSSDEKLARAKELGADATINYREDSNWGKTARALTGGRGVDHVLEVGGAGTLAQSLRAIRAGGCITLIGVLAGGASELNIVPVFMQQVRIQGILVGHRDSFEALLRAVRQHHLQPVVDRVFDFAEAPAAIEHMTAQKHFGKVVIRLAD